MRNLNTDVIAWAEKIGSAQTRDVNGEVGGLKDHLSLKVNWYEHSLKNHPWAEEIISDVMFYSFMS